MIELENVSIRFKEILVLDNKNIVFHDGNVYGVKGINGSGKTMIMRIISGLIYTTTGKV